MDIKDLNKRQLILLALLISFVVSIATGIVTVSLMQQMPKSVPQTINRVIQQTIEKVTTVQVPAPAVKDNSKNTALDFSDANVTVPIYMKNYIIPNTANIQPGIITDTINPLSEGIIISDVGLILVDSSTLIKDEDSYKIMLGKDLFDAKVIKKFSNGFDVLKILPISNTTDTQVKTDANNGATIPVLNGTPISTSPVQTQ